MCYLTGRVYYIVGDCIAFLLLLTALFERASLPELGYGWVFLRK